MKLNAFPALVAALSALAVSLPSWGETVSFRAPRQAPEAVVSLPAPVAKAAQPAMPPAGKMRVGDVRPLEKAASITRWETADGGYTARLRATSEGAQGLRVRLELGTVPGALEVRVQGSGNARIETMIVDPREGTEAWTPWTEGAAQLIEVFSAVVPSSDAIRVDAMVHFDISPFAKAAATCTLPILCTTGDPVLDAQVAERKKSMARINFQSGGGSFVCSATLIDTPRNPAAYMLTANHCVEDAASARSVTSFWFYESLTCESTAVNTDYRQVGGGVELVFTNFNVDSTLMLLNNAPPAGVTYAPLNPALLAVNTPVVSLSHPAGDSARFADGTMAREVRDAERPYNLYLVNFTRGMIQGGSSGSGAFIRANGRLELAGVLSQGPIDQSCTNPNKFGAYGRLEAFYPQMAQYIGAASPGADDAPNRPADATTAISSSPIDTLSQPLTFSRRIDYAGDIDVFRFTLSSRTTVTAYSEGSLDLVSSILDSNGVALESNDDAQTTDTNTGITRELGPGTYYLHVANWVPSGTGPYSMVVRADRVDTNYTALWWNAVESGWGINLNHQGDLMFGTLFTYADDGSPMWLVMSRGERQADGTYSGILYRTTGPAFNAPWRAASSTEVGSMRVAFAAPDAATLTYSVNGRSVTKSITRQVFKDPPSCSWSHFDRSIEGNVQDLWYNAAEPGWGINFAHQEDTLFATLFTYAASGQGLWLVMPEGKADANGTFTGALYRTRGPAFDAAPWGTVTNTQVGTMSLDFTHGNSATLAYTVDGIAVNKTITRQVFSSPKTKCVS